MLKKKKALLVQKIEHMILIENSMYTTSQKTAEVLLYIYNKRCRYADEKQGHLVRTCKPFRPCSDTPNLVALQSV